MQLKVCGVTASEEITLLSQLGIDFAGIWHGIDGGRANLPFDQFCRLVHEARSTGHLEPVLVTFLDDLKTLRHVITRSKVRWVQLHGFQSPALVLALKNVFGEQIRIIKVLHIHGQHCVEQSLIGAYERAGANAFLFDATTPDGRRIGSTGQHLDSAVVHVLADQVTRPFLLAGGISADNRFDHHQTIRHPRFLGIDVDTAAHGEDGKLCGARIEILTRSWATSTMGDKRHVELH